MNISNYSFFFFKDIDIEVNYNIIITKKLGLISILFECGE